MKLVTFKGGIHPPYNKEATQGCRIVQINPGEKLYIPLLQNAGAACDSLVKSGDYVKMGQKIGDSEAFVSSPVHSSVSGTVLSVEKHIHPSGNLVNTVVIQNDFKYTLDDTLPSGRDYNEMEPNEIIKAIREAGIVGMGGAGFPVHIKIDPPKGKTAEYIIINGAECEPYLSSDHRSMVEYPDDIIYGLKTIMKATGAQKAIIAIEDNKADAKKILADKTANEPNIEVALMATKYPQGSEKHVIKAVLNREVPSGGLPIDVGVIVNNVDTCIAIAGAIKNGMPVIKRRVTVSGQGVNHPGVFEISIGMTFAEVLEASGGVKSGVKKLVMGGPMMGIAQFDSDVPVIKTTSGILALTRNEIKKYEENVCLRCGKCVSACPMHLMPLVISVAGRNSDDEKATTFHAEDCIECGCCSFVCPSNRYLVESIRLAKVRAMALTANNRK